MKNHLDDAAVLTGRALISVRTTYCMVTSVIHDLLGASWQMRIFVKNWAIAGGFLVLAVHGAGAYALQPRR